MRRAGHDHSVDVRITDGLIPCHHRSERVADRDDLAKARPADVAMAQRLYDLMRDMRSRVHGDEIARWMGAAPGTDLIEGEGCDPCGRGRPSVRMGRAVE